ncbi:KLHL26 [Mytilus coruscus]|uniref:KLHL26 n=1 Tax=Mytilus coruscus TaxID=42192 RepID=A0A6J8AMW7_MYTCO|nr:KLHL26 [Mytilus coruscus]
MVIQSSSQLRREGETKVTYVATEHGNQILTGLQSLRKKRQLFDVTLVAEGQKFKAHRVVLASCCDYFRAMFTDGLKETTQDIISMNGVTAKGIKSIIEFAYSSNMELDRDNVEDILLAANHIQLSPVIAACTKFLESHLSFDNCFEMFNLADLLSLKELKNIVARFMCSHVDHFLFDQMPKLTFHTLRHILDCDFPVNCSEMDILSGILDWIYFKFDERKNLACQLFSRLRFSELTLLDIDTISNKKQLLQLFENQPEVEKLLRSTVLTSVYKHSGLLNNRGFKEVLVCVGGFSHDRGAVEDKLYAIGGRFGSDDFAQNSETPCECYDPEEDRWDPISPIPNNRSEHAGVCHRGHLYISGGIHDDHALSDFYVYYPEFDYWSEHTPMQSRRADHSMFVYNNQIHVIGGWHETNADDRVLVNSIDCYNISTSQWETIGTVPNPRLYASYTCFNNKVYMIGGWIDGDYQRKAETVLVLDLKTLTWSENLTPNIEAWEHNSCSVYIPKSSLTERVL